MVQIAAPQDWTGETVAVASAAAVLAVAETPEPSFTHVEPPSDAVADMFEAAAAAASTPHVVDTPTAIASESVMPTTALPPAGSPLVLWSVVGSAVILVGGLVIATWPERETPNTAEQVAPIAAAVAALPPKAESDESALPSTEQVVASSTEPHTAAKPISEESIADTEAAAAISDNEPALPDLPAEETAESTAVDDDSDIASAAATAEVEDESPAPSTVAASSDQQRTPVLKFDPLDFDPSQFSIGTSTAPVPPASSITEDPPGEAALAAGTQTESPDTEESNIIAPPSANPTITVRLGPVVNDTDTVDIATSLEFEVDSLEVADIPLNQFVHTLSNISGVPITLDPLAFELAGSSPREKVTVAARNVTLDELLQGRLRAARLEYVERDGHLITSLADGDRRSTREFDVSDLMEAGAADASAVAKLIQTYVSPQSWTTSNGSPRLR